MKRDIYIDTQTAATATDAKEQSTKSSGQNHYNLLRITAFEFSENTERERDPNPLNEL